MPAILIVDDSVIQGMTRRMILEKAHFPVIQVSNGREALARLASGESVGMVITDHCMPEMAGPELVRELRNAGHLVPVLVLSGLSEAEAEYTSLDITFRMKPLQPNELIALAHQLLFPTFGQTA